MADTSQQKEEEFENSFVENAENARDLNISNETNVKEEVIVDNSEEHIPEPEETKRAPSPPISHHSQEELPPPSSSNQPLSPDSKPDQPTASDQSQNGNDSSEVNEQKDTTDDHGHKANDSSASSDHPEDNVNERNPDDIEPEMKKVILQGYTQEESAKENIVAETSKAPQQLSPSDEKAPAANSTPVKQAISSPSKIVAPSQRVTSSQQKNSAVKDVKQTPSTTTKKPFTPLRSTTAAADKKPTPLKQTPKTIPSRPSAPLRPPATERRPPSSVTRRTPSSNPRATPKTPSTAPPRAMSAVRASAGKAENAAYKTPISNKKYENIQGKINASSNHKPGGGNVKIFHEKPKFNVSSKIGSLSNATHTPGGGQIRIESRKLNFKENAKPKIDDKAEIQSHVEKKIPTQKLEWKASSKVGSLQNANHKPAGGDVKIFSQKVKVDAAQSKVGSLDNANHKPAGGNVNIKEYKVIGKNNSSSNSVTSHSTSNSRRSSATRARMPGSRDPMTPEEALGGN